MGGLIRRAMLQCSTTKKVEPARHARSALDFPHLCGALDPESLQRALSQEPRQGADGPFDRLRPADANGLRRGPSAGARRGGQGRRSGRPSGRHARAARRHPARQDEHVHDHQRDGRLAACALRGAGGRAGRGPQGADGHGSERHHQGVSVARHLRLPAAAIDAAHQGHRGLLLPRNSQVEPHQRLLLPSAGSRRDAGAGAGLCAGHRASRARHREGQRRNPRGAFRRRSRASLSS